MGGCASTQEQRQTKAVDAEIGIAAKKDNKLVKLLFLGSGGSGKSTFFKQLKCIHNDNGFTPKDRKDHRRYISTQLIENFIMAFEIIDDESDELNYELTSVGNESRKYIEILNEDGSFVFINNDVGEHLIILWKEKVINEIYMKRFKYHLDDSLSYFMEPKNFERVCNNDYIPTDEDMLLCRYRTTGVIDMKFTIKTTTFHIFDVGGQKSERKKWIHCFDNVKAVIFVASLACYDELMFEDNTTNAMIDSLNLFEKVLNLQWFDDTSMILFLNKDDLFQNKIINIDKPLSMAFPELNNKPNFNSNDYETCKKYIIFKFHQKNKHPQTKRIHPHVTTATDKNNVAHIFNDVQNIIVNEGLERNNLI